MGKNEEYLKTIEETFNPQLISALYKNFSSQYEALLELIDNAVDDRVGGTKLVVTINFDENSLNIQNEHGKGMTPENLKDFFAWGVSKKDSQIGRYGQGGKASIGYLAKSFAIETKPKGSKDFYYLNVENWEDRSEGLKKFEIKNSPSNIDNGFVKLELTGLKREFRQSTVMSTIERIYTPLILLEEVDFIINGIKVVPKQVEFEEDVKADIKLSITFLSQKYNIKGWYGQVTSESLKDGFRKGFRIYQYGRCVADKEYFGYSDATLKWSMEKLYGELYIDFDLPLTMNKTDIDRDSPLWQAIDKKMNVEIADVVKTVRNSKTPARKETRVIEKFKKLIKRESNKSLKIELTHYDTRIMFKNEETKDGASLKINRDNKIYKEWLSHSGGEVFYLTLVYTLYEMSKNDGGKEVRQFIDKLSVSLAENSMKFLSKK